MSGLPDRRLRTDSKSLVVTLGMVGVGRRVGVGRWAGVGRRVGVGRWVGVGRRGVGRRVGVGRGVGVGRSAELSALLIVHRDRRTSLANPAQMIDSTVQPRMT